MVYGLPAQIEGEVRDNSKKLLSKLKTVYDGMSSFVLEALPGAPYTAMVRYPDGSGQEVKLPQVLESGIYLQANQGLNTVHLKVVFSGPNIDIIDYMKGKFPNLQIVGNYPDIEFVYRGVTVFSTLLLRVRNQNRHSRIFN